MLEASLRQWKTDVLENASDRFERRLSEELGTFRAEVARDLSAVRVDMSEELGTFRADVAREFGAVRVEIARNHTSLLRWMFVFWAGQAGVTLALVAMILRATKLL